MDTHTESNISTSTVIENILPENMPIYETAGPRRMKRAPSKSESEVLTPELSVAQENMQSYDTAGPRRVKKAPSQLDADVSNLSQTDQLSRKTSITRKTSQTKNLHLLGIEDNHVTDDVSCYESEEPIKRKTSLTLKI